ncbi:RNA polymerase sigma factor [Bacillus sp. JCM 19041]|uniref:RNA polymerase sigma factor n=1 Tax=Bacillus sp. JCM 19041 TaxID=1460637 RepID=UPI0006CF37D2
MNQVKLKVGQVICVKGTYDDIHKDLLRFACSIARHEQEAFDLMQDAWEKALHVKELSTWPYYKQKAWLYRVMKNALIDARRKQKRESSLSDFDEPVFIASGFSAFETTELLQALPTKQREIVFKRYWVGLSSNEIGAELNLPASTVRYQLAQAIQKLREQF